QSKGAKPVPVDRTVIYTDGSTQQFHQSIAVWEKGNTLSQVNFTSLKKIKLVKLGSSHVPDINKKDNEMEVK
ncbi:MAG: peptidase, partial [Chitinophagaceae bacterium]|nr:peptidase [Chitinophagaceae bacterium]